MALLSESQREELRTRAQMLRAEISAQRSRREAATAEASQANEDAALIAEVAKLQTQANAEAVQADQAVGRVSDAMDAMLAAAAEAPEVEGNSKPTATKTPVQTAPQGGPILAAKLETPATTTVTKEGGN